MYLYLPQEDASDQVPASLLSAMGELELVMAIDLHAERSLARADVGRVMEELETRGFYLQMPPLTEHDHDQL